MNDTKKTALRSDPTLQYKNRVSAIKNSLPRIYRKILFANYPEYDTEEGRSLLNNVMSLRSCDTRLTEILESIALGDLKAEN